MGRNLGTRGYRPRPSSHSSLGNLGWAEDGSREVGQSCLQGEKGSRKAFSTSPVQGLPPGLSRDLLPAKCPDLSSEAPTQLSMPSLQHLRRCFSRSHHPTSLSGGGLACPPPQPLWNPVLSQGLEGHSPMPAWVPLMSYKRVNGSVSSQRCPRP